MAPYLAPVERPKGLFIKLAYYFTRRQFGKVFGPLSVFSARMPFAFSLFYGKVSMLDKKLLLSHDVAMLIRERVATINGCLFCMDATRYAALKKSMKNKAKFDSLEQYRSSSLFTDAERAALDYVTELTKNKEVSPDTFARLANFYSEREICDIVWLVASEHLYNMNNIGLNIGSDGMCEIDAQLKG